ncbi:MAG TPA: YeeE/YedE family protein, partial [Gammaproteobacteria bacterium]|nr:YeeE/YedE family protein [Gammaproteobacteria bacterium]
MTNNTAVRQPLNLPLITAILVSSGLLWRVWLISGAKQSLLLIIALLLGLTLYSAAFSFAGAYRAILVKRQTQGVQAQLLMLAIASILFAPLLAKGELFGLTLYGATAPVALMLVVGAFLFGIGMQLGDGCASGTLYTVGGGNRRMLVTLSGFMAGSVIGTLHLPFWWRQPSWGTITLTQLTGSWQSALALQLLFLLLLSALLYRISRHSDEAPDTSNFRLLGGPWPLWFGALMLALLNLATLLTAGHPWTIAWGY